MIVYNVVFIGEEFEAIDTPMHDVESYASMELARQRVADFFRHAGRDGWTIGQRGSYWSHMDGSFVSITESELFTNR